MEVLFCLEGKNVVDYLLFCLFDPHGWYLISSKISFLEKSTTEGKIHSLYPNLHDLVSTGDVNCWLSFCQKGYVDCCTFSFSGLSVLMLGAFFIINHHDFCALCPLYHPPGFPTPEILPSHSLTMVIEKIIWWFMLH